ncbi:zinc finger protein 391-like [Nerophis ophidion]|uniref:zinc finger protein 391-like n=1 Tax=Nerophis ophidion TaxID=159077 RepID=UPI002ADFB3A2|nr:zinc finger protein 391-like [Nerophis ophidion]
MLVSGSSKERRRSNDGKRRSHNINYWTQLTRNVKLCHIEQEGIVVLFRVGTRWTDSCQRILKSSLLLKDVQQPPHIKEEEEDLRITQDEECLLGQVEAHKTKFPLTVVSVRTEDYEEKPPESSQLHHSPNVQQPPHIKEEEEDLWITQDEECLLGQEEADLTKFPLTVVSVRTEDYEEKPAECSQLHHSPNVKQPPHIKNEDEELWITQEKKCLLGQEEADLSKFPLTVVSVKTEDHEDKAPESSQLHHSTNRQQLIGHQEEFPRQSLEGGSTLRQEDPQPPHIKEERCFLGREEADLTKLPQTVVSVTTEDHEVDNLIAPLSSDSDDTTSDFDVNMKSHVKTHTREKSFVCSVCAKCFFKSSHLKQHMRTHTGERPHSCSVCAKRFFKSSHLKQHIKTHTGERPFSCSLCSKTFAKKNNMQIHMKTHKGEKLFSCLICAKRFSNKSNMQTHLRKHTGEQPFSCSLCGKRFYDKGNMQIHMRKHTGEKPVGCSMCAERFYDKRSMQIHMKTHAGKQTYICSVCARSFVRNCSLGRHMQTHTRENLFSCSVCVKRFSNQREMQKHMRTHTGEKDLSVVQFAKINSQ